jgi:V-type H+-transporting ATPase subunit C
LNTIQLEHLSHLLSPAAFANKPQTGTLSSLITLSDNLPKIDAQFTSQVSKLLETLRSLVNDDKTRLAQHARVNDRSAEEYLLPDPRGSGSWHWDKGRWGQGGKIVDVLATLVQVGSGARWSAVCGWWLAGH